MQKNNIKIKLAIFVVVSDSLMVLLRDNLLPSEDLVSNTSLDEQIEKLFLKTLGFNLENNYIEQLYTISDKKNEITIVYYALLYLEKNNLQQNKTWVNLKNISKKVGDHKIISYAAQRLQWKIEYTNVVYSLLPQEFSLSENEFP